MQQSSLFLNHTLLFYIAKSTLMIQKGQCFVYHFSEDNQKGYFFTGIIDKGKYVMLPTTYLNGERWNDEIVGVVKSENIPDFLKPL